MEIWKSIDGYDGMYEVSNLGSVRSFHRSTKSPTIPHVLAQANLRGYRFVSLPRLDGGKGRCSPLVHRLVAFAFIGNPPDVHRPTVNHIDFDKANNKVENLQWISHADNNRYSAKVIPRLRGEDNRSKITTVQVRLIRKRWKKILALKVERQRILEAWRGRDSLSAMAHEYGVSLQTCSAIIKRKKWAHVP